MSCAVLRVRRGLLKEQRFSDAKEWRYYWCLRFDVAIVFLTIIAMGYEYMDNIDLIHSYSFSHHLETIIITTITGIHVLHSALEKPFQFQSLCCYFPVEELGYYIK